MRIAHLSAEVAPFAKTGGLGDVVGALPVAQAELGHEVAVWMPLYAKARAELRKRGAVLEWVTEPLHLDIGYRHYEVGVLRTFIPGSLVPVYLLAHELFERPGIYDASPEGYDDGIVRYSVFVRAALLAMKRLQLVPDVLNAHDWHMAPAPMILAWERDWVFDRTVTVLTVHNLAYQGMYGPEAFVHLGLPRPTFSGWGCAWKGAVNLLKGGLLAAHGITAVSPTFAREMMTMDGGFGLDPVLRYRADDLAGIVNGIDPKVWNPSVDRRIPARYDREHLAGKALCRRVLLEKAGMNPDDKGFVVGVVGRLTSQKGYDLLFPALPDLLNDGTRVVFLGSGEENLEAQMHGFSHRAAGRFWGFVGFNEDLAHLIEAGSDAFLMPSRFEPCGLNQLYSLAYGTLPIVRKVGGLADTVVGFDGRNEAAATGFTFDAPEPVALRETVRWAARCFRNPGQWNRLMMNGMAQDYSWARSAGSYLEVYRRLRARKGL